MDYQPEVLPGFTNILRSGIFRQDNVAVGKKGVLELLNRLFLGGTQMAVFLLIRTH